jgi:hypothetical protein
MRYFYRRVTGFEQETRVGELMCVDTLNERGLLSRNRRSVRDYQIMTGQSRSLRVKHCLTTQKLEMQINRTEQLERCEFKATHTPRNNVFLSLGPQSDKCDMFYPGVAA